MTTATGTQRLTAYVHPGFLYASADPTVVTVILGSCVSVCLWDPRLHIGGANHFLLPHHDGAPKASPRYGASAVPALLEAMERLGSRRSELRAKVFGGASMNEVFHNKPLGAKNVELALAILDDERIAIDAVDALGTRGRKVVFASDTGETEVRLL